MRRRCYDALHIISIAIGALALGVDISSNTQWMFEQVGSWFDSNILMVITIGIGGAICATVGLKANREGQPVMALGFAVLWCAAIAFSASATLDRVASQRDAKLAAKREAVEKKMEARAQAARAAKQGATAVYVRLIAEAQDKADAACGEARRYKRYRADTKVARVVTARAECDRWQREVARNRDAVQLVLTQQARQQPLLHNVVAVEEIDAYGKRIAAYTRGYVSAEAANLYLPALAPICLILMASLFLSWGINGRIEAPEFDVQLTGKAANEAKVARFVCAYRSENGTAPSIAAVAAQCGLTQSQAQRMRRKALAEAEE